MLGNGCVGVNRRRQTVGACMEMAPDGTKSSSPATFNLAVETTGRVGSVAIGSGDRLLATETFRTTLNHAVELLPTIDRLCRTAGVGPGNLRELYVSGGPGGFTGLRIGITVARTLAWSTGARVVRVPTLDVVAQNALDADDPPAHVGVVLDAQRGSVFAAAYRRNGERYEAIGGATERDPAEFLSSLPASGAVMGEGVPFITDALHTARVFVLPESLFRARAEVVCRLGRERAVAGRFDHADSLVPIYVRRPHAEEVWDAREG